MTIRFDHREIKPMLWCGVVFFIVIGIAFAVNANNPLIVDELNLPDNRISSHVLDISLGRPAAGIKLTSYKWSQSTNQWVELRKTKTNEKGRVGSVHPNLELEEGSYKIRFDTGDYFALNNQTIFFPFVEVVFMIENASQHYHIPLTLSNFGYSTYKGQ
ncbi:5-hydroxyisourate hydrolase [Aphelenchoides besseyi]|nr:5-hydroxyisourate hydrolase [Aphelenchoides besseyi]KAI6200391.1 5-hydroxyisourate hydrolase [Aphelenchoides besseyi]